MKLDNEFTVGVPVSQAWEVLTDLELIAPCMPGAALTGVTDGVYTGKVKIKVGPVTAEYSGTAQFSEKDDVNYRAVIDARGRDARGNGNATATISANLRAEGDRTVVNVTTDLAIAGRIAQFGSGMIKEVSARLLGQFVTCLEGRLGGDLPVAAGASAVSPASASSASASSASAGPAAAGTGSDSTAAASTGEQQPTSAAATASATSVSATTMSDATTLPTDAALSVDAAVSPDAGATGAGAAATAARTISAGPEPVALNLMSVAGGAVYKRLIPLVIGLVVVAVIIYLIVR